MSSSALSSIVASPSLSILALDMKPAVLAGVGKGCWLDADVADWESEVDMGREDCGERSDTAEFVVGKPPLDCEFIE